ncbi:ThuA domain-containing protein [Thalassobellus suaedae]|uniref:ThuA domain-containing protein n=1 Tax=Thalassobellus suaedae TaxID=3074124 RepID=A0ABY9Y6N1_9FLAO|nr:ThuA domain-containing protein [Flavobacteriaceae bacterium HL-DH10]
MKLSLILWVALLSSFCYATESVLVFTKTEGFRHKSIESGVQTINLLGVENDFEVTHTENAKVFTKDNLKQYGLVIFLNTTGDVLNEDQQKAFENYIKSGGSFMGIHAASDTEFEWAWFGKLVGAYFLNHPEKCEATINRVNKKHQSTKHLPKHWIRYDEWYNFKSISDAIHVLLTLDESSYKGGKNGEFHPIAWCQEFDGGKMFYTALGHTKESYSEPAFKQHILGGILYCLNR